MKTALFHILTTFRWMVVPALKLLSALFAAFLLIALFADDPAVAGFGKAFIWFLFSVGLGSASWYYDALIKKLSPINQTKSGASGAKLPRG